MGCENYRDAEEAEREDDYYQRLHKAREVLEKTSLASFMATDLPSLLRLQDFEEGGITFSDPFYDDLERIEKRLSEIKG